MGKKSKKRSAKKAPIPAEIAGGKVEEDTETKAESSGGSRWTNNPITNMAAKMMPSVLKPSAGDKSVGGAEEESPVPRQIPCSNVEDEQVSGEIHSDILESRAESAKDYGEPSPSPQAIVTDSLVEKKTKINTSQNMAQRVFNMDSTVHIEGVVVEKKVAVISPRNEEAGRHAIEEGVMMQDYAEPTPSTAYRETSPKVAPVQSFLTTTGKGLCNTPAIDGSGFEDAVHRAGGTESGQYYTQSSRMAGHGEVYDGELGINRGEYVGSPNSYDPSITGLSPGTESEIEHSRGYYNGFVEDINPTHESGVLVFPDGREVHYENTNPSSVCAAIAAQNSAISPVIWVPSVHTHSTNAAIVAERNHEPVQVFTGFGVYANAFPNLPRFPDSYTSSSDSAVAVNEEDYRTRRNEMHSAAEAALRLGRFKPTQEELELEMVEEEARKLAQKDAEEIRRANALGGAVTAHEVYFATPSPKSIGLPRSTLSVLSGARNAHARFDGRVRTPSYVGPSGRDLVSNRDLLSVARRRVKERLSAIDADLEYRCLIPPKAESIATAYRVASEKAKALNQGEYTPSEDEIYIGGRGQAGYIKQADLDRIARERINKLFAGMDKEAERLREESGFTQNGPMGFWKKHVSFGKKKQLEHMPQPLESQDQTKPRRFGFSVFKRRPGHPTDEWEVPIEEARRQEAERLTKSKSAYERPEGESRSRHERSYVGIGPDMEPSDRVADSHNIAPTLSNIEHLPPDLERHPTTTHSVNTRDSAGFSDTSRPSSPRQADTSTTRASASPRNLPVSNTMRDRFRRIFLYRYDSDREIRTPDVKTPAGYPPGLASGRVPVQGTPATEAPTASSMRSVALAGTQTRRIEELVNETAERRVSQDRELEEEALTTDSTRIHSQVETTPNAVPIAKTSPKGDYFGPVIPLQHNGSTPACDMHPINARPSPATSSAVVDERRRRDSGKDFDEVSTSSSLLHEKRKDGVVSGSDIMDGIPILESPLLGRVMS